MPQTFDTVTRVLQHQGVDFISRGELFIHRDFLDRYFSRARDNYILRLHTTAESLGLSLIGIDFSPVRTSSLLSRGRFQKLQNYFIVGYITGPVTALLNCKNKGGAY